MKTKKINSNEIAESKVINAMGNITRATKKVLMNYVISMYLVSFAKVIAYLDTESDEGKDLLSGMDDKTRNTVLSFSKDFTKTDSKVTAEVEHILTASGMELEKDKTIVEQRTHKQSCLVSDGVCTRCNDCCPLKILNND